MSLEQLERQDYFHRVRTLTRIIEDLQQEKSRLISEATAKYPDMMQQQPTEK
jgi:hypothetical protein